MREKTPNNLSIVPVSEAQGASGQVASLVDRYVVSKSDVIMLINVVSFFSFSVV